MPKHCCSKKKDIFQEAISHCRWKRVLRNEVLNSDKLKKENLYKYAGNNFDQILLMVYNICHNVKGIGMLTVYDITSAICRYNNIIIDKIYIVGNGPKRAISLLEVVPKTKKIGRINLKYVEIAEILNAFSTKKYDIDSQMIYNNNCDDFESYLCNWQKGK